MIPFAPPRIDQVIIDEVTEVLKSGWITTGPRTREFERKLADYCGCKAVICLNSATAGLEIMLRWFDVGPGDEVIIPAYTYAVTANVVIHCGATPVMVDSGPDFNVDPEQILPLVNSRTKVIIPVDFGGFPCDYKRINKIAEDCASLFIPGSNNQKALGRILVIADAAHSIGSSYFNKLSGALTDVSVFSFHAVKNLTTAEGGAIALNLPASFDNKEIYNYLCAYTLHGQSKDALAKMQKGNWKYDIITAGYKCNMTDIAAAIGLTELSRYDTDMIPARKRICDRYSSFFKNYRNLQLPLFRDGNAESSYHLYPLRITGISEQQRDIIITRIFDMEVSVNVHFIPLPMHTFYKQLGYHIGKFPSAYDSYSREISLPVYYDLTDEQIDTVCKAVVTAASLELK